MAEDVPNLDNMPTPKLAYVWELSDTCMEGYKSSIATSGTPTASQAARLTSGDSFCLSAVALRMGVRVA